MRATIVTLWAVGICFGLAWLWNYSVQPGIKGDAPAAWPTQASITPVPQRYNLVLSLHPHCPCSSATAEELAGILARTGDSMQVHVLLYKPHDAATDWLKSSLTSTVESLPHTTITADVDGDLAERFGALTSGDAQLFAPDGRLVFHGGITPARGHVGDNAGKDSIIATVTGAQSGAQATPVFGCAIRDDENGGKTR
jgi:hypothetical protein